MMHPPQVTLIQQIGSGLQSAFAAYIGLTSIVTTLFCYIIRQGMRNAKAKTDREIRDAENEKQELIQEINELNKMRMDALESRIEQVEGENRRLRARVVMLEAKLVEHNIPLPPPTYLYSGDDP